MIPSGIRLSLSQYEVNTGLVPIQSPENFSVGFSKNGISTVLTSEQNSNPGFINQLISSFGCGYSHTNIPDDIL